MSAVAVEAIYWEQKALGEGRPSYCLLYAIFVVYIKPHVINELYPAQFVLVKRSSWHNLGVTVIYHLLI